MKAVRLVSFGDPPKFEIQDVPDPVPGPGQVVIDLRAAAFNRRDPWVWTTRGYCKLPVTLGSDGAGGVSAGGGGGGWGKTRGEGGVHPPPRRGGHGGKPTPPVD